jgi:Coenzyme PQQ synthesis protein D (PqqD)
VTEPRFHRAPGTLSRSVGEALLLVAPDRRDLHELSPTAVAVWDLLDEARSLSQIAELLTYRFDTLPGDIVTDVDTIVRHLVESGHVQEIAGHE